MMITSDNRAINFYDNGYFIHAAMQYLGITKKTKKAQQLANVIQREHLVCICTDNDVVAFKNPYVAGHPVTKLKSTTARDKANEILKIVSEVTK